MSGFNNFPRNDNNNPNNTGAGYGTNNRSGVWSQQQQQQQQPSFNSNNNPFGGSQQGLSTNSTSFGSSQQQGISKNPFGGFGQQQITVPSPAPFAQQQNYAPSFPSTSGQTGFGGTTTNNLSAGGFGSSGFPTSSGVGTKPFGATSTAATTSNPFGGGSTVSFASPSSAVVPFAAPPALGRFGSSFGGNSTSFVPHTTPNPCGARTITVNPSVGSGFGAQAFGGTAATSAPSSNTSTFATSPFVARSTMPPPPNPFGSTISTAAPLSNPFGGAPAMTFGMSNNLAPFDGDLDMRSSSPVGEEVDMQDNPQQFPTNAPFGTPAWSAAPPSSGLNPNAPTFSPFGTSQPSSTAGVFGNVNNGASSQADKLAHLKAKLEEKKRLLKERKELKSKDVTPPRSRSASPEQSNLAARNAMRFTSKTNDTTQSHMPTDLRGPHAKVSNMTSPVPQTDRETLSEAVSLVGTCPYMCPDEELIRREVEGDIQMLELPRPGELHPQGWSLRNTVVKRFRRSAADYKLDVPEWVRPPDVLENVCGYLEEWVMERDRQANDPRFPNGGVPPSLDVYQFVWYVDWFCIFAAHVLRQADPVFYQGPNKNDSKRFYSSKLCWNWR
jgi:hypothetical protein